MDLLYKTKRRYLLDSTKNELTKLKMVNYDDPPKSVTFLILSLIVCTVPASILWSNPSFFTSQISYPNVHSLYVTINEAIRAKDLLINGSSNFWFDDNELGYPMFISQETFPLFFTAMIMMVFERVASPLCLFRWLLVIMGSLVSLSLYKSARHMMVSRTQSLLQALLVVLIVSPQMSETFFQMFGKLLLPLTVSKIYTYGMQLDKENNFTAMFFLCLTYCCHIPSAVTCTLSSLSVFIVVMVTEEFNVPNLKASLKRLCFLHLGVFLHLLWWIVAALISYPYTIAASHKPFDALEVIASGKMFDEGRSFPCMTCMVLIGAIMVACNCIIMVKHSVSRSNHTQKHSFWLTLCCCFSFFQTSLEYSFVIQYFGLLTASIAVHTIQRYLLHLLRKKTLKSLARFFLTILLTSFCTKTLFLKTIERTSTVEASTDLHNVLKTFKEEFDDGRVLAHERLGTGEFWDLANIPCLSGKPGIFGPLKTTPSHFYLQSMALSDVEPEMFFNLLELYNIRYIALSTNVVNSDSIGGNLVVIATANDVQLVEVQSEQHHSQFFDFVRLPGYMDGNMNTIKHEALKSLDLYSQHALFYLNPSPYTNVRNKSLASVQVVNVPSASEDISIASWKLNNQDIDSAEVLDYFDNFYRDKWLYSVVIEEKRKLNEYHALVDVSKNVEPTSATYEHLLLKVSYHPFWRCEYTPVDHTYQLSDPPPNRTLVRVLHVTPNMMAVTLPPGRYHVVFRYRFPGILKLYALLSVVLLLDRYLCLSLFKRSRNIVAFIYGATTGTFFYLFKKFVFASNAFFYDAIFWPESVNHWLSLIWSAFLPSKMSSVMLRVFDGVFKLNYMKLILPSKRDLHAQPPLTEDTKAEWCVDDACEASVDELPLIDRPTELALFNSFSSEQDSSFAADDVYKTPPTPPKHYKKSYRKKHHVRRNMLVDCVTDDVIDYITDDVPFQSGKTSPRVNKILKSLRRNALMNSPPPAPCRANMSARPPKKTAKVADESIQDGFSPMRSSSPDYSLSSAEFTTSSPDGSISDSSFEYSPGYDVDVSDRKKTGR